MTDAQPHCTENTRVLSSVQYGLACRCKLVLVGICKHITGDSAAGACAGESAPAWS
jgi:hypothetical protein